MHLSSTLARFSEPETLKMAKMGRELRAKGIDIIDLSLGEPDFDTPKHIKEAAKKAIDDNWSHYTPVAGYLDLRQAICEKLERDNGLHYSAENIIVSTGAKQSIANLVLSLVDEGDEVIIPTPYWVTYSEIVRLANGVVKFIDADITHGYKITPQQLEAAITPRTKLFMFSSPCNPTGAVYTKNELEALAEVFARYPSIYIMSDEIYEYINYNTEPQSIAQFQTIKDRVVVINGLSKGFAMTGWRLGYMAATASIAKACEKIQGQFTSGPNSIAQRAAIAAITGGLDATKKMVKEFAKRRERMMELLAKIPGLETSEPDGAFYVFPVVKHYFGARDGDKVINNADELCMYLLNKAHVSSVTGKAFGQADCIRFSFANSMKNIEEGLKRVKHGLEQLTVER